MITKKDEQIVLDNLEYLESKFYQTNNHEQLHIAADNELLNIVAALGYQKIVDKYEELRKYFLYA